MTVRKRPTVTVTLESSVIKMVDDLSEEIGLSRSELVERCILAGIEIVKKQFSKKDVKENKESQVSESLADAYLKEMLKEYSPYIDWQPVM